MGEKYCVGIDKVSDYSVKHIEKLSKGHENQCRITQVNGLDRCGIRQVLLYVYI